MKAPRKFALKISLAIFVSLLILGYGFFQARNILEGPTIEILTPKNGENVANPLIIVKGVASNITHISLNDRQIFVDKAGNFNEKLLVPSGYTIIKLEAQDKFGRNTRKLIELNYTGSSTPITTDVTVDVSNSTSTSTQNIIQ